MSRQAVQASLHHTSRCFAGRSLVTSAQQLHYDKQADLQRLEDERQVLLLEAKRLTLSLYRLCARSVRVIRRGNEYDEKEFQAREEKRKKDQFDPDRDVRLSMISLLPPVDREDELRSRADYYMQYARENFVQESDCLAHPDWVREQVSRYVYHLKRGNDHRQWLLSDMRFEDPYTKSFDYEEIDDFERRAMEFVEKVRLSKKVDNGQHVETRHDEGTPAAPTDDEEDDFWDNSDDEEENAPPPAWYKNPRSM